MNFRASVIAVMRIYGYLPAVVPHAAHWVMAPWFEGTVEGRMAIGVISHNAARRGQTFPFVGGSPV